RISCELEPALADDLIVGVAHGGFDHLGHRRSAVHALEMGDLHFARTEAVDPDATLQIVKALIYFGVELGGRYDDFVLALETFRQCFGNLHCSLLVAYTRATLASPGVNVMEIRKRVVAPHFRALGVVRAEGFEPPRLSSREPKSRASTNSATPARGGYRTTLAPQSGRAQGGHAGQGKA